LAIQIITCLNQKKRSATILRLKSISMVLDLHEGFEAIIEGEKLGI
jgi:hypothetical protein